MGDDWAESVVSQQCQLKVHRFSQAFTFGSFDVRSTGRNTMRTAGEATGFSGYGLVCDSMRRASFHSTV